MYMKDKIKKVTVRLNVEQYNYVVHLAKLWGVSESEMFRKLIDYVRFGGSDNENQ